MAYSSQATVITGTPILAAWGNAIRDNEDWLATNAPNVRVNKIAAFSHNSTGNFLAITFDNAVWDNATMHSNSVNPTRLTVPTGASGRYIFGGSIIWGSSATGERYLAATRDGITNVYAAQNAINLSTAAVWQSVATIMNASAADYFELAAYQNSGGTLAIAATNFNSPFFWAQWLST